MGFMKSPYDYYITPDEYKRAEKNGISRCTLNGRVRVSMWDKEKAITEPLTHKDSQWSRWKEVAKKHGVGYQTYYHRVKRGLEPFEAATRPVMEKEQIFQKGRTAQAHKRVFTDEELRIATSNGIQYQTALYRYRKGGWNKEDAITKPPLSLKECMRRAREKSSWERIHFGRGLDILVEWKKASSS
ncbi:gp38 (plasmid) [Bacillus thuringiensis MC28]|nr:gp38 [Bacillus thuringiensis MC28]